MPHDPYDWTDESHFALPSQRPATAGDAVRRGEPVPPPGDGEYIEPDQCSPYGIVRGLWLVRP